MNSLYSSIAQKFFNLIDQKKYHELSELCHKDFIFYSSIDTPLSFSEFIRQERDNMDPFPDFKMEVHELFEKDNKVAVYFTFEGEQKSPFLGIPATGNRVRISVMAMLTFKDGLIIENRSHYNALDMIQQLKV